MKNKTFLVIVFLFGFICFSQKKTTINKKYIDSVMNSIELIFETKINSSNESFISDFKKIKNKFDSNLTIYNRIYNQLNKRIDDSYYKIDSLILTNNKFKESLIILFEEFNLDFKNEISSISSVTGSLDKKTNQLNNDLSKSNLVISNNSKKIVSTGNILKSISDNVDNNEKKVLIAISVTLLIVLIVYIFLNKKWNNETNKISLKQKEILEKQLEDSQKLADWLTDKSSSELSSKPNETDHSFAKRVADEIVRMSNNLSRMDDSIRGFKQLSASVRKLIQSLSSNDYEIIELLNKPYSSGMNLEANFVIDEKIKKGSKIITRVIKPQINYKGKMIQSAQVEVSQND